MRQLLKVPAHSIVNVQPGGCAKLVLRENGIRGNGKQRGRLSKRLQIEFESACSQIGQTCEVKISRRTVHKIVPVMVDVDVHTGAQRVTSGHMGNIVGKFKAAVGS